MSMSKRWFASALITALSGSLIAATPAQATPEDFLGTWENERRSNGGITKVVISQSSGNQLTVQVYGRCTPNDCDWGTTELVTYGANISDSDHTQATASFVQSFADKLLTFELRRQNRDRIAVQNFTEFTDGSSRSNYTSRVVLKKTADAPASAFIPLQPIQTIETTIPPYQITPRF